jgi:hypothetical protein
VLHQLSDRPKKLRVDTSGELLALLDQYSELQFEGIATSDELWACYLLESDSMFAGQPEEVIPRLRPGMSIKKVMIAVWFTAWQLIGLNSLPKGQRHNQESFVQNILLSLRNEKKSVSSQKTAINSYVQMDNSMCHNGHQFSMNYVA